MKIAVLGINHKLASLPLREAITKAFISLFLKRTPFFSAHFILLDTCNRTELYFSSADVAQTQATILEFLKKQLQIDFEQKLYSFFSHECFLHLAKVTAGLDSALIGETEIQGQVKNAYEKARKENPLCFEIHYLFQKCLKIGKDLRRVYQKTFSLVGLDAPILALAEERFPELRNTHFLLVGASEINKKLLQSFLRKGCSVTIANRTEEKLQEWEKNFPIKTLLWNHLYLWRQYDIVITATRSPSYLLKNSLQKPVQTKLLIDLSVPRNIDPKLARLPGVQLFHIDQMQKLAKKQQKPVKIAVEGVEKMLLQKVGTYLRLYRKRERPEATGLKLFEPYTPILESRIPHYLDI